MAVVKTKHEFIDDNPYLVYSGEPESTLDNAGGGGGGGGDNANLFVIEVVNSPMGAEQFTLVTPLETVKEEWQKHQSIPVIKKSYFYGGSLNILAGWFPISSEAHTNMINGIFVELETSGSPEPTSKFVQETIKIDIDGNVSYAKSYPTS